MLSSNVSTLKCGDFHIRLKTPFRKNLKYGENDETNDVLMIDSMNVFKKRSPLSHFSSMPVFKKYQMKDVFICLQRQNIGAPLSYRGDVFKKLPLN